jgi:hypothetical protein
MRKLVVLAALTVTAIVLAVAPTASAGVIAPATPGVKSGPACVVAGVSFLIKNNLLIPVAKNGLNLTALGGPDQTVSLATVIRLHLTKPATFAGTENGGLPGATWCKA